MEFKFEMGDMAPEQVMDFGDGQGLVPAHRHPRGEGWVADTAWVDPSAFVGEHAQVFGNAKVIMNAIVDGYARVYDNAMISGNARVYGDSQVAGCAQISGEARVSGRAKIFGNARITDCAQVYDFAQVYDNGMVREHGEVFNNAIIKEKGEVYYSMQITDNCIVTRRPKVCLGFEYNVTITDHHVTLGCVSMPPTLMRKAGARIIRLMGYDRQEAADWVASFMGVADFHKCADIPEELENTNERDVIMALLEARVGVSSNGR